MINIAINGFGRIGRNVVRAIYENGYQNDIKIVAINDLSPIDMSAHLLEFDSTHGRFNAKVDYTEDSLIINGDTIPTYTQRDPAQLPWKSLNVDVVMECTVFFVREKKHHFI